MNHTIYLTKHLSNRGCYPEFFCFILIITRPILAKASKFPSKTSSLLRLRSAGAPILAQARRQHQHQLPPSRLSWTLTASTGATLRPIPTRPGSPRWLQPLSPTVSVCYVSAAFISPANRMRIPGPAPRGTFRGHQPCLGCPGTAAFCLVGVSNRPWLKVFIY
jgi:hypothetical protein